MHPDKVDRRQVNALTDLPNVGPRVAADLELIGIQHPRQLRGHHALDLYNMLCVATGVRQDPCVLDVFMSLTDFIDGGPAQAWWAYTPARKARHTTL